MKKSKKFIALFLVFFLLMLSTNLYSKERRGAELIITKKNGGKIEGELIAVKEDSLLILTKWSERDRSIDIADIKFIIIVKKSKSLQGLGLGLLIGAGSGALVGFLSGDDYGWLAYTAETKAIFSAIVYGSLGGIIGALIGGAAGGHKTIQIEGMTDLEVKETLDKLRKKARIRDYK